jgi:hypothetical protein
MSQKTPVPHPFHSLIVKWVGGRKPKQEAALLSEAYFSGAEGDLHLHFGANIHS